MPAHYETTPSLGSLAPTLRPEQFTGMTREAYRVAGEIPQTLAQLPCYCHCDQSFGHKSLQSCFVDDHAAHCAVCVNEALAANQLQKQGLTPAQIRDRIVAEYSQE
ncbi:MAG TPA: CYCXC family (seleno)protein [Pyrinomonadaceae bacterium]